jgi:hypothetical protein
MQPRGIYRTGSRFTEGKVFLFYLIFITTNTGTDAAKYFKTAQNGWKYA